MQTIAYQIDPKSTSLSGIEKIVKEQTGYAVNIGQPGMTITRLRSTDDMLAQFALILPVTRDSRIAFNTLKGENK